MAKVIKHHNRYDKDICIMKHIFLWLNQINIDIIKYFLENNFYLFHHHLNRLKVLNDNHVDLLKMVDWIMLVFYLYVLLLIVPNKIKIFSSLSNIKPVRRSKERIPLSATSWYRVLPGDSFFPTTITSCSSEQKASLTQSSSAQLLGLPAHTD